MKDIIFTIKEVTKIKVKNDSANYSYSVESQIHKTSNESYNSLLDTVSRIRTMLKKMKQVDDIKTNYNIMPLWEYKPRKRLLGYKTVATISYTIRLTSSNKLAASLQNKIINLPAHKTIIMLDSINYTISNETRKRSEVLAIEKAIYNGKRKANVMIDKTYPNRRYTIIGLDVNTEVDAQYSMNVAHQDMRMMETRAPTDIISQGISYVTARINMKIRIDSYY